MSSVPKRHYLGLCAIARDETPYLREWVAYHHLIGFERIFIYDNESKIPVHETLGDMIASGMVTVYDITGQPVQLTAYSHCLLQHRDELEWFCMLDLDEYLVLEDEDDARIFFSRYEGYSGVSLHRRIFTSNGHLSRPEGLVMENFTEAAGYETHLKAAGKASRIELCFSPHDFTFKLGYAVNTEGIPVMGGFGPFSSKGGLVNHYNYRSQQDYEDKIRRGDACFKDLNPRNMDIFYRQAAWSGKACTDILRHAPCVKEIMRTGRPLPYLNIDSSEVLSEAYPFALKRLSGLLKENRPQEARACYRMARSRFKDKAAYANLGAEACRASGDAAGAREAAMDLLAIVQDVYAYYELFLAAVLAEDHKEASVLASFILAQAGSGDEHIVADLASRGFEA